MAGGANMFYDNVRKGWVITGKDGTPRQFIGEDKVIVENVGLQVHKNGTEFNKILKISGSLPEIAVGTAKSAVATVYCGASGVSASGISVGDIVFVTPKSALVTNIGIGGCQIPTTNTLVVKYINPQTTDQGVQSAVGVDIVAFNPA